MLIFRNFILILYTIISCLFLSNCTSTILNTAPPVVTEKLQQQNWQTHKEKLTKLQNAKWVQLARIGIINKSPTDNSTTSTSLQQDWLNYSSNNFKIILNNSVTFGSIEINNRPGNTTLEYNNKTYQAQNPEQLLLDLTQLNLPISQLKYWIVGLPSPNYKIEQYNLNQYSVLANLKQAGFTITYDNYTGVNNYILPYKIIIKSKSLYLKIMVESWNI